MSVFVFIFSQISNNIKTSRNLKVISTQQSLPSKSSRELCSFVQYQKGIIYAVILGIPLK